MIISVVRKRQHRGVAQFGRALRSGRRGRVFESRRLDFSRPDGQAVKTTPSHGVNPGSIPGQVTDFCVMQKSFLFQKKLRLIKSKYSARTAMPVPNLN